MKAERAADAILDLINEDYAAAYNSSSDPSMFVNWMLAPFKDSFEAEDFAVVVEDAHLLLAGAA
tara:strand:- start:167 stop:358 length:192 start_codon:yes stop_codon:yes gene_type:complete